MSTLLLFQICRVEDITVEGLIKGSVVHFHRARTITVESYGMISASGMGMFTFLLRIKVLPYLVLLVIVHLSCFDMHRHTHTYSSST